MINDANNLKPTLSSLPLQILIHFNWHYGIILFVLYICLFTYKAVRYYYPGNILGWDFVTVFCYAMVESSRLFLATKGNKTSQLGPLTASMLLSLPIIVLHAYYMELQLYVLRAEVVLNAIAIFFVGVEFIVSFFVVFSFLAASRKF
mmetsp:Transcript_702/g.1153  ORF Transcript_702/g.1153 Transcript_702/m.1153 type:complete len:147 (+) Transcript_702:54-494(+)